MTINSKSTKAEILAAYKELDKQKKSLESQLKNSPKVNPITNKNTTQDIVRKSIPTVNINSNSTKGISNTIQALAEIQSSFGGAVSNLSEHLIVEATQLETVRNAITLEKLELIELHKLEKVTESTIDDLIKKYQADSKKFAEELNQQQESDRQEIETLKQAWAKEKETHSRFVKTRNEEYRKAQQREKEEYEYNLDLTRDLDEEEYNQQTKLRQQELESSRKILEKQWQEKEAEIAKLEQEYSTAQEKVVAFEEQLRAKIKQANEEGKGIGNYQAKIKADLRAKEIQGETRNYQLRIDSLEQTIEHQESRIRKLSQQLDASLQQVQDLAVKAIEGSSNRNSFEAMKAIAMEQAKTQSKGK
ncbi:hypothetical protein I4641_01305 [Waterburya agarophytonicola K14]|uniref:Myosin heavy chain n=1 Tax=Waterburya agarophytonicola KI4 TaxID=2874699 RepID=A0A964FE09_9CYAN|nr:hypothetical protein [Waterburya agarophytonicola]MCC0175616.1 hypothetical protein [Waterburya agarophytonicola KI4]